MVGTGRAKLRTMRTVPPHPLRALIQHPALLRFWCARRSGVVVLWCLAVGLCAQDRTGSLTEDFPGRTAKERSRIAAKETEEAKQDAAYQRLMIRSDSLFRIGDLQGALAGYTEARNLRPYNVYPKVKIEDLKALIQSQAEDPVHAFPAPPDVSSPEPVAPVVEAPPVNAVAVPAAHVRCVERRFREGAAFVIERRIPEADKEVLHRRVSHPTGQVFYFKDGRSVDAREWEALSQRYAFSEQAD